MSIIRRIGAFAATAALALSLTLGGTNAAHAGDGFERTGDIMQIALPAAAAVCAARQGRFGEYAGRFAAQTAIVHGFKRGLGESDINRRPSGSYKGFPSGHTAAAMFGATELAKKCFNGNKLLGALAYGSAAMVGVSRITSDNHNLGQVAAGAAIGFVGGSMTVGANPNGFGLRFSFDF